MGMSIVLSRSNRLISLSSSSQFSFTLQRLMYVVNVASNLTQFGISMSSSKKKKTTLRTHLALRM